jgi:uncharacterized protein YecT (DUF1311 family)
MRSARAPALALLIGVAAAADGAPAGTLAACMQRHGRTEQTATCIRLAQRQASDEMLDAFEKTRRRIDARFGGDGALTAALTESQRDFERYVQGQCTLVHALVGRAGSADLAALACETDLLRQRTAVLRSVADLADDE